MKVVEIREQVRLPLTKCVELVLSGIRYRLFRASITVVIISLATAFLMAMVTESITARRIADVLHAKTGPRDRMLFWVSRLSAPMTDSQVNAALADARPGGPRWQELKTWGGLTDDQLTEMTQIACEQVTDYQAFFERLSEGDRRALVGRARGKEVFQWLLAEEAHFRQFARNLAQSDQQMSRPPEEFKTFLSRWQRTEPLRQAVQAGHARAAAEFARAFPGPARQVLAAGGDLRAALARLGFLAEAGELDTVRQQASLSVDAAALAAAFNDPRMKDALAKRLQTDKTKVSLVQFLSETSSPEGAAWLTGPDCAGVHGLLPGLSAGRIAEVARRKLEESDLSSVEAAVSQETSAAGMFGFSTRTVWLLAVSLLVCVVGIANAMLMSVTERFREIATMKCLGATDGFIMVNFVLESVMQGVAGGAIGTVLGFLLGGLRSWAKYGWMAVEQMPVAESLVAAGASLALGVIISALAAVYPAWVAARLAPMEAMRIE